MSKLLRFGMAFVFLWFGMNQLISPESWVGYVPSWLYPHGTEMSHEHPLQLMHNIPKPSVHLLIMGNGLLETIFGLFLALNFRVRLSSIILAVHLFIIALSQGYNDLLIRDMGLAIATLSLALTQHPSSEPKQKPTSTQAPKTGA